MVERSLSMREAVGSMPTFSTFVFRHIYLQIFAVFGPKLTFISDFWAKSTFNLSRFIGQLDFHWR